MKALPYLSVAQRPDYAVASDRLLSSIFSAWPMSALVIFSGGDMRMTLLWSPPRGNHRNLITPRTRSSALGLVMGDSGFW